MSKTFYKVLAAALLTFVGLVIATEALGQSYPIPLVAYQVGQTFYETNYSATTPAAYPLQQDADRVLVAHAFSLVVMRPGTGPTSIRGFSTPEVANRPGDACPFPQVIDRHQGIRGYRAANGWLIIGNYAGASTCRNVVVFRWTGSQYAKTGDVAVTGFFANASSTSYGIEGNVAYVPAMGFSTWTRIDLNTLAVLGSGSTFRDEARREDWRVDGGNPNWFLVPSGLPSPTPRPTPITTETPVPEATTTPSTSPTPQPPQPSATPCQATGPCRPAPMGPGCWDGCSLCPCPTATPAASRTPTVTIPTASPTSGPPTTTPTIPPSTTPDLTSTPLRMTPVVSPVGTRPPVAPTITSSPTPATEVTSTVTPTTSPTPGESGPSSGRGGLVAAVVAAVIGLFVWLVKKFGVKKP